MRVLLRRNESRRPVLRRLHFSWAQMEYHVLSPVEVAGVCRWWILPFGGREIQSCPDKLAPLTEVWAQAKKFLPSSYEAAMATFNEAKGADSASSVESKTEEWKAANEGKDVSDTLTALFQAEVDYEKAVAAVSTVLFFS